MAKPHRFPCVLLLGLLLAGAAPAAAADPERVATDAQGQPLRVQGSVVVVEPDIELSQITAGGLSEPRRDWS